MAYLARRNRWLAASLLAAVAIAIALLSVIRTNTDTQSADAPYRQAGLTVAAVETIPGGLITRHPSSTPEPVVVLREQAWELAKNAPDLADSSIIPTLVTYLQYPDAEVKWAAASAITVIAISEHAHASGLRTAVRDTSALTTTLFSHIDYDLLDQLDRQVRKQAVDAIRHLYVEVPRPGIERLVVARYNVESNQDVLRSIVGLLCNHGYDSSDTIDVLTDAANDPDPLLSTMAVTCLAAIDR